MNIGPIRFNRTERAFTLTAEIWLPQSRPEIFSFFANAGNLEALTPPWLHFEILTPSPIQMAVNALIDYQLRVHGWPVRWQTQITAWEPPVRFVDEQLRGPYRLWRHEHTFAEAEGGTLVRDVVYYRLLGGTLVNAMFVQPDLEKVFAYRQEKLAEHFQTREQR